MPTLATSHRAAVVPCPPARRARRCGLLGVASALAGLALIAPLVARAEVLRSTDRGGRSLDWSAGELVARGLGVADRRAPSPATARDAARSRALADARRQLVEAAGALPWAGGGTLGGQLAADRLAEVVQAAVLRQAEPLVDGSWRVQLALPLEVLRQAAHGPRELPAAQDDRDVVPVLLVQVAAPAAPLLGVELHHGKGGSRNAVLWLRGSVDGAPLAAPLLARAPTVKAVLEPPAAGAPGRLRVRQLPAVGKARVTDATLLVVVLGE